MSKDFTMSNFMVAESPIPGLLVVDLKKFGDERGYFQEKFRMDKLTEQGFPNGFTPKQNNVSFNAEAGVTRGIHAEPWNKYITMANGRVFGAWVDLREGESFGTVFTHEINEETAIFVPAGVANSYQTLTENTLYSYLVDDYWTPEAQYTFVNLADETLNINWPTPLSDVVISEKDQNHPMLTDVTPMTISESLALEHSVTAKLEGDT